MRKTWKIGITISTFIILFLLASCAPNENGKENGNSDEAILIVTSFTLIEDIVKQMGGDLVTTHNLVPIGTDPHEYEPLPEDTKAVTDAAGIIYNGFNLEGGADGWLMRMVDTAGKDETFL